MEDLELVQSLETSDHLYEYSPDFFFLESGLVVLVVNNLLVQVSVVSVVHHYAEVLFLFYERLLVTDDIGMLDRR